MYLCIALIGVGSLFYAWRWIASYLDEEIQASWHTEAPRTSRPPEPVLKTSHVSASAELRLT